MPNNYAKDEIVRQIDNEIEYLLRAYQNYYADSSTPQSRSELLKLFVGRAVRKSKRGAAQEPVNLRAKIGDAGFGKAHN
jgi:hypothetical protein